MLTNLKKILALVFYPIGMFILPMFVTLPIAIIRGYDLDLTPGSDFFAATVLGSVIGYGITCLALLIISFSAYKEDFRKVASWSKFCLHMLVGLACTLAAAAVGGAFVTLLGETDVAVNQQLVEGFIMAMPVLMIITVVIFGPIVEEIIFRLVLMNLFPKWKPAINIFLSSLIFGAMHVLAGGLIHIIPYFLMGVVFGVFYVKFDNIWHATILHILHNGATVVLMFVLQGML